MAEYGAHLTSVTLEKPSIFEVLAQENLQQALRPAILHLLNVSAKKWPTTKFQFLLENYNKLYTLLNLIVQHYYLKNYGGSFAEVFYGLQRTPIYAGILARGYKLPFKLHLRSLLVLCFASQFKMWLDSKFEQLEDEVATGHRKATALLQAFLYLHPLFHATWQGTMIAYQIAFVFGKSPYHSPFLHLAGGYLTPFQEDASVLDMPMPTSSNGFGQMLKNSSRLAIGGLSYALSTSLTVGAFFLQYMDWWQSSNRTPFPHSDIPPPAATRAEEKSLHHPHKCPICQQSRVKETALATSGFVFCYKCIRHYVEQNGICPITKYPTSLAQLVCLYPGT